MNETKSQNEYQRKYKIFKTICKAFDTKKEEYNQDLRKDLDIFFNPHDLSIEIISQKEVISNQQIKIVESAIQPFCAVSYYLTVKENQVVLRVL